MTTESPDRRQTMEQEMTVQELIALMNAWEGTLFYRLS